MSRREKTSSEGADNNFERREKMVRFITLNNVLASILVLAVLTISIPVFVSTIKVPTEVDCIVRYKAATDPTLCVPIAFPWTINNVTYRNLEEFHFKHCPYSAKYIIDSKPPTFHKFCESNKSLLGWPGKCLQTYSIEKNITDDAPIQMVFNDCLFIPGDDISAVNKTCLSDEGSDECSND